jgi:DNA invertase Pin-like site-specific DNA recombinase
MRRNAAASLEVPRPAIYARFSTDMQNPVSIERQVRTCQEYAERQGWGRVPANAIYPDEAVSGSRSDRTAYQELLAAIAGSNGRPPFDIVLVEDLSRLTRDMQEATRLVKMAPIWGARVIGVSDGVDTARKGTKLLTYMKAAMAEGYLDELKERIRGGLRERFLRGHHPGGTLFGFSTEPILDPSGTKDRFGNPKVLGHRILVDPAESEVVKRIFRDAAAGLSPREIAAALLHDGTSKPCSKYRFEKPGATARQSSPWNPGTVLSILHNERYAGRWRWNRAASFQDPETGRHILRAKPADEVLVHERPELALVDKATWDKVQAHMERRRRDVLKDPETGRLMGRAQGCAPGKGYGNPWHGLVFCAECGGPFPVIQTKAGQDGRPIRRLGCNRRHHMKERCGNTGVCRLADLDAALRDGLEGYFTDTKLAERRMKRFLNALAVERRKVTKEEAQAQRDLERARANIEKIKRAILDGMAGPTTAGMLKDAEAAESQAQARLEDLARLRQAKPAMLPPADVLGALRKEAYYDRRAAYRQFVQRVELRSLRAAGRRYAVSWEATIIPRREAGIEGVPKVVFGRIIASGCSPSGRDGRSASAGG